MTKELEALKCLNFLKNEAINDIACLKNSVTTKTLYQLYFANFDVIEQALQRLEKYEKVLHSERLTLTNVYGSHLIDYKYDDYNRQYDIDKVTEKLGNLEDIYDGMD